MNPQIMSLGNHNEDDQCAKNNDSADSKAQENMKTKITTVKRIIEIRILVGYI